MVMCFEVRGVAPRAQRMGRRILFLLLLLSVAAIARGDERVRQVQEELRRRNLYFGEVDGQQTPELANALKRYQSRKGFAVTGAIDDATATSLDVQPANPNAASAAATPPLPDVPVLRSDLARELPAEQRVALEQRAETNPEPTQTPAPPAEAPPTNNITPERVREYVEQYLHDSETDDIAAQTKYFDYPVQYFDHGTVDPGFVQKDVTNYCKHWPERKYTLIAPPKVTAAGRSDEVQVEFPISFDLQNHSHTAKGRTNNYWTLRQEGDELKIVAIREQRLRQ